MLSLSIAKMIPGFRLDVAFTAADEVVALFGPSGAGKSLTLRCIAGLLRPEAGRIEINGLTVFDRAAGIDVPARARSVGYVFQNYALFPHLSVWDNIAYGVQHQSVHERAAKVEKLMTLMRLGGLERRHPADLSGGQRQRVAVARALATEPQLLLLDEPFSALDSPIRSRLHEEVLQLLQGMALTTVLVTHDLNEAYSLSRKMVVLEAGRVLQAGSRDEVLRRPTSKAVARFVGTKNLFRGLVESVAEEAMTIRAGDLVVQTPGGPFRGGELVDFCVRPEEIMLVRPERELGIAVEENCYVGQVVGEIAHGPSLTLLVKLLGDPLHSGRDYDLHVDLPAHAYCRLGIDQNKQWTLSLKRNAVHVIGLAARR